MTKIYNTGGNMNILGVGLTDIGCKRPHNEDAFLCDPSSGMFIVADGMGGQIAGETASKAVITIFPVIFQKMLNSLENQESEVIITTLCKALRQLSYDLYQQSQKIAELRGLGSTAAVLFIRDGIAYIACVGDSRIYMLRDTRLLQITEDQTIAASLVRAGHLSPQRAERHPLRHALEEYIGKKDKLNPGVWSYHLRCGDRWLICSDGLTKGLPDQQLRDLLLQPSSTEEICQTLVSTAKSTDGTDNITAIVVDIVCAEDSVKK